MECGIIRFCNPLSLWPALSKSTFVSSIFPQMTFSNKQRTDVILFHSAESYTVCVGREGVVKAIVWKEGKTFLKEKNKYCIQNTTDCLLALQHNAAGKQHLLSYTGEN